MSQSAWIIFVIAIAVVFVIAIRIERAAKARQPDRASERCDEAPRVHGD